LNNLSFDAAVIDLDGTLIGRDEEIASEVQNAVNLLSQYIRVSIVSGREPYDVLRFAGQLSLGAPQVSDNGAVILDPASGSAMRRFPMTARQATRVVNRLDRDGFRFIATHANKTFTTLDQINRWDLARVSALDLAKDAAEAMVKEFEAETDIHVVKAYLPYNDLWAVDFTKAEIDKGSAVRYLAELFKSSTRRFIAIGDSYNDIPMLSECGLAIAMGNAPNEVKDSSDLIAPNVEKHGLKTAIEEFIFPILVNNKQ
jgi:hypothetical protein